MKYFEYLIGFIQLNDQLSSCLAFGILLLAISLLATEFSIESTKIYFNEEGRGG